MSAQYVPKSADDNFDNIKFFGVSTQFVVMFQKRQQVLRIFSLSNVNIIARENLKAKNVIKN